MPLADGRRHILSAAFGSALVLAACSVTSPPPTSVPTPESARPAAADPLLRDLLALLPRDATYLERLASCFRAAGWEAEVSDDGESLAYEFYTESNRVAFQQDKRVCDVLVPPPPLVPLTDAEIRAVYAHWVEMRACLATFGYITSEPPTEEEFVLSWATTGPWSPYLDVPGRALEQVEDRCPQSPPDLED